MFAETPDDEVVILSLNLKFKDGVLQSVTFTNSYKNDYAENLQQSQIITIEVTENIDDFTFDKAPY